MKFDLLKPKRIFWASVFFPVILLFPVSGWAITIQEVPNPRKDSGGWITDMADILNDETEAQINQMISELETKTGKEMAVVTVPTTSPAASPKSFATELFNSWGIGKKGQDNGVLFLISVGDRRVEIETGYGVEGILPDAKVGNIIKTEIIPHFKKEDFAGGTLAGSKALIVVLKADQASPDNQAILPSIQTNPDVTYYLQLFILFVTLSICVIVMQVLGELLDKIISYIFISISDRPRKILIAPQGRSCKKPGNYIFLCADCKQPMDKVDYDTVQSCLSEQEITEQELGSVGFQGWRCPSCSQQHTGNEFHVVAIKYSSSSGSSSSSYGYSSGSSSSGGGDFGGGSSGGGGAGDSW
ncbi:TPM domain-containing protein [Anabaena sp. WFMT]|uniref:TPM domain-containing protein n=1 Tax=Anabaena sp. WFMT TaxID=3449730 RepID=UPI003F20F5CE